MMTRVTVRRFLAGVALGAVAIAPDPAAAQDQRKPRVAVVTFENKTTWWPDQLGSAVADQLATRLVQAGDFSVIERQMLQQVMEEQGLQMAGAVDPAEVTRLGELAGVDYLMVGSVAAFNINHRSIGFGGLGVSETSFESTLTVRAIDTRTAEVVAAAEAEGQKKNRGGSWGDIDLDEQTGYSMGAVREAVDPALDDIIASFQEQIDAFGVATEAAATVVGQGSDGSLYIDQGENYGIQVGQKYEVHRVIDEIRDADGNLLDQVTDVVGHLEVTRVLSQSSVASIVDGEYAEHDVLVAVVEGGV